MRWTLFAIAVALLAPASAVADVTMTVREVPLAGHPVRTLASTAPPPARFNLVAAHWRGSGAVRFRTRSLAGRWSGWRTMDTDGRVAAGWRLGNLDWTGAADAIRFRTRGSVTRLRAYYLWSPPEKTPVRRLAMAGAPPIIPRLSWGADESIRRAPPQYFDQLHFAVVHHTAGSNNYTPAQSAAIVRGIEVYHVKGNGWNDIGYNFLVDKYGQVFEGRYGGVDRNVVGAHAEGFNTGAVGVAVLGSYNSTPISAAAKRSLEQLLAWRLDLAHVDPLSTLTWPSGGNPRFPAGTPVFLRAISGHRDTGFTDCPGNALYAQLPQIAKDVAAIGLPKLYAPTVTGTIGGPIRFTGRLTSALPWTITIADSTGRTVATGTGTSAAIDWTWDATAAPPGSYRWTMAAGASVRGAAGTLGSKAVPLAIQKTAASPAQIAPGETTTVSYTLTAPATVTATLVGPNGQTISTLLNEPKPIGAQTLAFTAQPGLANGTYTVALAATGADGKTANATVTFVVDDILSGFTATPAVFSPAKHVAVTLTFTLNRAPTSVIFQVLRGTEPVANPASSLTGTGPQTLTWNGLLDDGTVAPDGTYTLTFTVTDGAIGFTREATVTLDSTKPRVTVLSYKNTRFRFAEAATVTLVVGGRRYTRVLKKPATTTFWFRAKPRAYTLIATDPAGNSTQVRYRAR